MPKLDEHVRIKGAADYPGVARSTLRNRNAAGESPVYRHPINGYRLFRVSDLDGVLKTTDRSVNNNRE
jgi:hypothetical protein